MHIMWINEPADFTGGCEQYIFQTANSLKKKKYKNTLLYDVEGAISPKFLKIFDSAFPIVDIQRQIKEAKPDVIYIHRLAGKKILDFIQSGIPTIRFFHDHKLFCLREHKYRTLSHETCTKPMGLRCYPCLGFINRAPQGIKLKFVHSLKKEQRWNHKLSAYIVASQYMKSHLIAHGFEEDKIKVIPLYAQPPQSGNEFAREEKTLLFAGQLLRGKGLDTLLEALSIAKTGPQLWVAGEGHQKDMFMELCTKFELHDRVRFLGKKSSLDEYYQKCSCVIVPSRTPETFALIGPEAMRYQTPVIACDVGGIRDWLQHEKTGLLVPANHPKKLAAAIDQIIENKEMRIQMGAHAQQSYYDKFTPEKHIAELSAFFEGLK
ncbi:glycosyl transferase [Candidatus Uabimicrobium amorphum]|uniref:Glycosyl transferase n=2 Tax=Uabimicrobium amorphum TaxID=2596890 RepID=A0A5S9ISG7_UABAM|nr:glycosyl transferase [Candidatus Uabimicrobium amorphum]